MTYSVSDKLKPCDCENENDNDDADDDDDNDDDDDDDNGEDDEDVEEGPWIADDDGNHIALGKFKILFYR